ncbi:protein secretion system [Rhodopirellula islandica]|uniref:Protein secretion system n=1 Tax=Rhodopirellula islandica TaxID=595434 RepID=A0A0J1BAM5_RHOIS|nr:S26 family signal peptidase [Rhodopirellula islandica]KLU03583.1 protein secretion system [Rhodopirellula islandica]
MSGESIDSLSFLSADVVTVRSSTAAQLQGRLGAGEMPLVVLDHEGQTHLKRVLAGPGQKVTSDDRGRMRVDGKLIEPSDLPGLPIDIDQRRTGEIASRWSCFPSLAWQRDPEGNWFDSAETSEPRPELVWLVYEHRNVYRGNVVSRVFDDCPANMGLDRRLHPVDQVGLTVQLQLRPAGSSQESKQAAMESTSGQIHAVAWTDQGVRVVSKKLPEKLDDQSMLVKFEPQAFRTGRRFDRSELSLASAPAVSATSPVAIGWSTNSIVRVGDLRLWRPIQWRMETPSRWPLQAKEWFVAGDNTPVSVDSRRWGPIHTDQIIGICDPIVRDETLRRDSKTLHG